MSLVCSINCSAKPVVVPTASAVACVCELHQVRFFQKLIQKVLSRFILVRCSRTSRAVLRSSIPVPECDSDASGSVENFRGRTKYSSKRPAKEVPRRPVQRVLGRLRGGPLRAVYLGRFPHCAVQQSLDKMPRPRPSAVPNITRRPMTRGQFVT